jgi:hypothetical protein
MLMTVVTLIASHSAGIPSKRLRGYAQCFFFVGLCYAIVFSMGTSRGYGNVSIEGMTWRIIFVLVYFGVALFAFALSRRRRIS